MGQEVGAMPGRGREPRDAGGPSKPDEARPCSVP